ncbi:MAG: hypothetical protein HY925_06175, partial [Elusimicrobia bacterium]|nr:hypothetical protein [Elusimicrobiota bacterium]
MAAGLWLVVALAASAQDYRDYLCKEIQKPFFRVTGKNGGVATVRMARRLAHDISFDVPKPPKTKRVLVAGESVAEKLWSADHDALTEAGAKAWPGWRVEDLNAGMTAYNSRRIAGVLEEGLEFDLDGAVVLSGNNEHDALELCPSVWDGLERQFMRSKLYRTLASAKRTPEEHAREPALEEPASL